MAKTEKPDPNPPGRPPYEPTDFDKGRVQAWTVAGYNSDDIALRLCISEPTLRKYYAEQLEFGKMDFLANVAASLGRQAIGAPAVYNEQGKMLRAEIVATPAPGIFIMKTQGKKLGWSERAETGAPIGDVDWSKYSDAEIELIARAQQLLSRDAVAPSAGTSGARPQTH